MYADNRAWVHSITYKGKHYFDEGQNNMPEKQPKFPKMHFAVAFSGKRIGKSFEKSNPNPPKCILRLLFRKMPGR